RPRNGGEGRREGVEMPSTGLEKPSPGQRRYAASTPSPTSKRGRGESVRGRWLRLSQLDLAVDHQLQGRAAEGERHLGWQLLIALQPAGGERLAHRVLDGALAGDADLLQEFAQAHIEDVVVHRCPPRLEKDQAR